jgi:hypothetical protein
MSRKKIRGNMANLLTYIGSLYRNPADAAKEYISNALDAWSEGRQAGIIEGSCRVEYALSRDQVRIHYNSPGMNAREFEQALDRVAASVKLGTKQIGQLGIGLFAFNQIGDRCTFYSRKSGADRTVKVSLRRQSDEAEIEAAVRRESLEEPGMTVVIGGLQHDPTKARGPLSAERLQHVFAQQFDRYLRTGELSVGITSGSRNYEVRPVEIALPAVGEAFGEVHLAADWQKVFRSRFWFDATGRGVVSIRHRGVPIVEDLKAIQAYGLEDSVYAQGYIKGFIDADFLRPLPARTGFEQNQDWIKLLEELDRMRPTIEAEVDDLRLQEEEKRLTETQRKAVRLAREILDQNEFRDLELLGGLRRPRAAIEHSRVSHPSGRTDGTKSKDSGREKREGGLRVSLAEMPFEEGPSEHSRFVSGVVQVNTSNPDYRVEHKRSPDAALAYDVLMIGKETIAYTDHSRWANYYLEKLLSFHFQVRRRAKG